MSPWLVGITVVCYAITSIALLYSKDYSHSLAYFGWGLGNLGLLIYELGRNQ